MELLRMMLRRSGRRMAVAATLVAALSVGLTGVAPAAASGPVWPLVGRGQVGYDVRTVQYLLRHHGHDLAADGIFGPVTERTVRVFQRHNNLLVDGLVGAQTWSALVVEAGRGTPPGDLIKALQTQLVANQEGQLEIDGIFGPRTEAATLRAERHIGGTVNGILSEAEWKNLVWRRII